MSNEPAINNTEPEITPVGVMATDAPKWIMYTLSLFAYGIPLAFLMYVLYWNYLPFGYNKDFTIDIGTISDTDSRQLFYLEPSRDLSERKTDEDGATYRELDGIATAIFDPRAVLNDAEISVSVENDDIDIMPPVINFNSSSVTWDYTWDFTQGKNPEELGLVGNAYSFDNTMYFDGNSRLELPDSANKFEDNPFIVYVEWIPTDRDSVGQQIIGHFNWELWQSGDSVLLRIGRMNDSTGDFLDIIHKIDSDTFFGVSHNLVFQYVPSIDQNINGYFELFVDGLFAGRTYIGQDKLFKDYGGPDRDLSIGKTYHNYEKYPGLKGNVKFIGISQNTLSKFESAKINSFPANYTILTKRNTKISDLKLYVQ